MHITSADGGQAYIRRYYMSKAIQKMRTIDEKGFTLVELLIVIAIIAILAAIAIPQFAQYQQRAIRAGMVSDAKNIATMQEAYFSDFQSYSSATTAVTGPFAVGSTTGNLTKNDTLVKIDTATTPNMAYTIYIANAAGGSLSQTYSMDNGGDTGFYGQ